MAFGLSRTIGTGQNEMFKSEKKEVSQPLSAADEIFRRCRAVVAVIEDLRKTRLQPEPREEAVCGGTESYFDVVFARGEGGAYPRKDRGLKTPTPTRIRERDAKKYHCP